jgi:2-oxo-4-hydroxy-4-carboxy-5-ureidoimidazoline decarboxylase
MGAGPPDPGLLPIEELNQLPPERFAEALKPLFEAAAPLAEALFGRRPFRSYEELLDRAAEAVQELPDAQQVEVVNAHPRIGESADAVRRTSLISYREQGYDHESELDSDELRAVYRELAELNRAYEERFGFRFVVFVNRRPKSVILKVLRERLGNTRSDELRTALHDMLAIARDRLRSMV